MEERRISNEARLNQLESLLKDTQESIKLVKEEVERNTKLTEDVKELLILGKSFFTIMRYVGIMAKWVTLVSAAIFALFHFGSPPK